LVFDEQACNSGAAKFLHGSVRVWSIPESSIAINEKR
jgi:hypothetical protein